MTETRATCAARQKADEEDPDTREVIRAVECLFGPDGWGRIEFIIKGGRVTHYRISYEHNR